MTIQGLIDILKSMDPQKSAFVVLFKPDDAAEQFDIIDVTNNSGYAQMNIHQIDVNEETS
jgi:hypothetical protein